MSGSNFVNSIIANLNKERERLFGVSEMYAGNANYGMAEEYRQVAKGVGISINKIMDMMDGVSIVEPPTILNGDSI